MRAMVLKEMDKPLLLEEVATPKPAPNQVLVKVESCGVCRTDLHIIDQELPKPKLPLILGHQIVGIVEEIGSQVRSVEVGQRIGIPWLGGSCGHCKFCDSKRENLCRDAVYTGYTVNGGFAEYCTANSSYCFPIPKSYPPNQAAPLLCAGLIGYRSYRMTGDAQKIGFYGFGAAAHILIQVAIYEHKEVFAFTREGDLKGQAFAKKLGAVWAGSSVEKPPEMLDAAIIFAPVGSLIPVALQALDRGGKVVCAGIHMSDIPSFPYSILWEERSIQSVANLTRKDGEEFLELAPKVPIKTNVTIYPLEKVNEAFEDLRQGNLEGSAVITLSP